MTVRKIPTLFTRDPDDRRFVIDEVTPGAEWVLAGEGIAHRKIDGTCMLFSPELLGVDSETPFIATPAELQGWWARREIKPGAVAPPHYQSIETDPVTSKTVGWEPAEQSAFAQLMIQAVIDLGNKVRPGTYELIGPRINRNPEGAPGHQLVAHADTEIVDAPRDFEGLRRYLLRQPWEGVVWHAIDGSGRMVKAKQRDFRT